MEQGARYKAARSLITAFLFIYPLLVNPFFSPVFTLPKVSFLWFSGGISLLLMTFFGASEFKRIKLVLLPPLIYLLTAGVSLVWSGSPLTGLFGEYARWDGLLSIVSILSLFILTALSFDKDTALRPLGALMASGFLVGLLSIYERIFKNPVLIYPKIFDPAGFGAFNGLDLTRSIATFGSPLYVAAFLSMVLTLALAFYLKSVDLRKSMAYLLVLAAGIPALFLTFSRGAWLGVIVSFFGLFFLSRQSIEKNRLKILSIILLISSVLVYIAIPDQIFSFSDRFLSIFKAEGGARPGIWESSLKMVEDKPFLGHGIENYKIAFVKFKPAGWVEKSTQPVPDKAHNEILQQISTVGIAGFMAGLWMCIYLIMRLLSSARRDDIQPMRFIVYGSASALLAYMTQSLFNFFQISASPIFWLIAAIGLCLAYTKNVSPLTNKRPWYFWVRLSFGTIVMAVFFVFSFFLLLADINFQRYLEYKDINIEQAYGYASNAAKYFPYEERYLIAFGQVNYKLFSNYQTNYFLKRGVRAFDDAISVNRMSYEAYAGKGNLALEASSRRNMDKQLIAMARQSFNKSLSVNSRNIDVLLSLGISYAYENNFIKALDSWEKALKINSSNAEAYFNIGWAYDQMNAKDKAKENYARALALNPNMSDARMMLEK